MEITNKNQLDNPVFKKNIYENTTTTVDKETGEIINSTTESTSKAEREPDYIKVYLNTICAFKGLSQSISPVLLEFCKYMTWASDRQQYIKVDGEMKEEIAEACKITVRRVEQCLKEIKKSQIFIQALKKDGKPSRGKYIVNPYIIAKGEWTKVKVLRAEFNFNDNTFSIKTNEEKNANQ